MAIAVSKITLGVDVSKDQLVVFDWHTEERTTLENQPAAIKAWLKSMYGPVRIAVEPTSSYHLELVEQAHTLGFEIYLINPRQLVHYRKAVGERNKTDQADAWLLARYLDRECASLRPFKPQCAKAQRLWALIKRRGVAVSARQKIQQSFRGTRIPTKALVTEIQKLIHRIDQHIQALIRQLAWQTDYQRCLSIPGIGPVNAAALTAVFHRGAFAGSDAYVAFIGLDVRLRESGKFKGKRKLTKCGEAEIRRLLFCAAQAARSYPPFDNYLQQQLEKGLSKIAAKVILARKLARIAFSLLANQQSFKIQEIAHS